MLQKGAITEVSPTEAHPAQVFLVPNKNGGMRPVVNLKHLNVYIIPHHFKKDEIHTLKEMLRRNDWMTRVDLKDSYFMIPVNTSHRWMLHLLVRECDYQFTCLPCRLSCVPGSLPRP